jgi:hypothetical protein
MESKGAVAAVIVALLVVAYVVGYFALPTTTDVGPDTLQSVRVSMAGPQLPSAGRNRIATHPKAGTSGRATSPVT